ncbi:uncharacterized protein BP5553_09710 [Venustampulla echinocandica]|uniref:SWI-SNF chromatin-remodeling complex protein n=1 Tax=Venustampulla echinocandica TaxID=2656787 RepID=A0A370TBS3_9HELO|nr:uncharacterized protein BP5553_09710 [Venustampulla echinocandica]RDL31501.1 hypothetical protein BP5553_09710 [Venustampulla echinocandica]
MARPFPNTFDDQSPMSPQSGSNTPISYRANVNRQKTKKWATAKAVDYGGDDWGDDDDYDYDYDPSPPPPPVAKPTGFRQQGQALPNANTQRAGPTPPPPQADNSKKAYGDLPALPGPSNARGRSNSFEADEERNFSNNTVRQESPSTANAPAKGHGPATRFSQITGMPSTRAPSGPPALSISTQDQQLPKTGLRKPNQTFSPISESPVPNPSHLTRQSTGEVTTPSDATPASDNQSSTSDYQARRDYSPSAVPPPLSTRASPAPQGSNDPASAGAKFPARKSSLSQSTPPNMSDIMQPSQEPSQPKPWNAGRSSSPGVAARPPSVESATTRPWSASDRSSSPGAAARPPTKPAGKTLPFIRPADIYKRVEEERERARQSMESGRPSMDSVLGTKSSDRSASPATRQPREQSGSENLADNGRRWASAEAEESSDSGRRLMPMLEPVKERKSEYGFDGFNIDEQAKQHAPDHSDAPEGSGAPITAPVDDEIPRKQSVSPKLPDLNRISGFGIDMFSQPNREVQDQAAPKPTESTTAGQEMEPTLQARPSIGLRSVVHQAFDRTDDSSVPDTPASAVRRTDSESTGTTGISPIMSRVPSTAIPESRNPDFTTPSIPEAVNEPKSPTGSSAATGDVTHLAESASLPQPAIPGFKPGHRRDINTPSPGNSPARSLDLTDGTVNPQGQKVIISDSSPTDDNDNETLQPPEPGTERPPSLRPVIPGGWTSYDSTEKSDTTHPDAARAPAAETEAPPTAEAGSREQDEDDSNITPATTKHPLPKSALEASIAAVGLTEAAGGTLETAGERNVEVEQNPAVPTVMPVNDSLPTPDPAKAPSGSLDSGLNPRLLPKLEQAPAATQLRPDTVHRAISDESSVGPTPPPKATPQGSTNALEYFPQAPQPLEEEKSLPTSGPQALPTLNVDNQPEDVEYATLAKGNLAKSVPDISDTPGHYDESRLSTQLHDSGSGGQGRESTYLPSEYDNYWASTADDQEQIAESTRSPIEQNQNIESSPAITKPIGDTEFQSPPIAILNTGTMAQRVTQPGESRLKHRFSWERSSEDVSEIIPQGTSRYASNPNHDANVTQALPNQVIPPYVTEPKSLASESAKPEHTPNTAAELSHQEDQVERSATPRTLSQAEDYHVGRDAAALAGPAILGAAAAANASNQDPSRRLSLADENDPRSSAYGASQTPPVDEHPSRSSQPYFLPPADQLSNPSPSTVSPINSPLHPLPAQTGRILAFKEIVDLKSQQQRIQTFDETRHRYAAMNSGLDDWISTLKAQHPEHADVTGLWTESGSGMAGGPARSRFSKPIGVGAPPLQQPYYQQYLNASSPISPTNPASNPTSRPGSSMPNTGAQQGFSPSGSKLTSQQVQAKGKELLHTAGIFGGKAGKAGKGLLAKGKSRFRGSGGGDKADSPVKSKAERRTSWGIPLTLSRASGRQQQEIPVSKIDEGQTPTTITTPQQPLSRKQSTDAAGDPFGMSGAIPHISPPVSRHSDSSVSRDVSNADKDTVEVDSGDKLGVPAPISKYQPSWDPFNATPIAEEEGFRYDVDANHHPSASEAENKLANLEDAPVSEPSNNDGTRLYSSGDEEEDEEEHNTSSDWVMVSPEPDMKDAPEEVAPVEAQPADVPTTSILDRPRGSMIESPSLAQHPIPTNISHPVTTSSDLAVTSHDLAITSYEPVAAPHEPVTTFYEPAAVEASQPGSQQQSSSTSFLPPIRRTSTFGIKIGSRHKKQRFPIEDEEVSDLEGEQPTPTDRGADIGIADESAAVSSAASPGTVKSVLEPAAPAEPPEVPHEQFSTGEAAPSGSELVQQANPREVPDEQFSTTGGTPSEPQRMQQTDPRDISYGRFPATETPSSIAQPMLPSFPDGYSQRTTTPQEDPRSFSFTTSRSQDVHPGISRARTSQDSWRPNVASPLSNVPQNQGNQGPPSIPRNSWEPQRNRGWSGSSQNFTHRPDGNWAPPLQPRSLEQPPSSAQRYPDLFRPDAGPDIQGDGGELPAHYYQQPIPREAAFLPRQQTNEYQLPGVGPPREEPRPTGSKRNSGFFKDLGERISHGTVRERPDSRSRDRGPLPLIAPPDSRGKEYTDSIGASEDGGEYNRRSSLFGSLSRASTTGLAPPQSRDSMVAHHSRSRTDLLASASPSPELPEKRRFLFGGNSGEPKPKPNKLQRSSTSSEMGDESGKKKRFSGLGGLFSKSGNAPRASMPPPPRPQATRQLSYNERQPIESPPFDPRAASSYAPPNNNLRPGSQNHRSMTTGGTGATGQSRNLLSKFRQSQPAPAPSQEPRKSSRSKTRRASASASGLLNGIIGRGSHQQERDRDDSSRSDESQPHRFLQPLPPAQTYTDLQAPAPAPAQPQPQPYLQESVPPPPSQPQPQPYLQQSVQPQPYLQPIPSQNPAYQQPIPSRSPSCQQPDRGRHTATEPAYDNVPIPGGYSLVRGQGAMSAPTDYDPRGFNRFQQADPRYIHPQTVSPHQYSNSPVQRYSPQTVSPDQYGRAPFQGQVARSNVSPQHISPAMQRHYPQSVDRSQYQAPPVQHQQVPYLSEPEPRGRPGNPRALETLEGRTTLRRLSREDLVARSPARTPDGQQPPYQLTLPNNQQDDDGDRPPPIDKDLTIDTSGRARTTPTRAQPQHDSIQRLQQPVIRHPGSPASYTVPDTVFSPVNPSAEDIPPPPPPKYQFNLDPQYRGHSHSLSQNDSLNVSMDLDRSNTVRSGVSQVSRMSALPDERAEDSGMPTAEEKEMGLVRSPSPPSPIVTPELRKSPVIPPEETDRGRSDETNRGGEDLLKMTVVVRESSPDLYDASPRLPIQGGHANREPGDLAVNTNLSSTIEAQRTPTKTSHSGAAGIEDTPPDRRLAMAQEEKIVYDGDAADTGDAQNDDAPVTMSATSYPGQEWNPYGMGNYEDGPD